MRFATPETAMNRAMKPRNVLPLALRALLPAPTDVKTSASSKNTGASHMYRTAVITEPRMRVVQLIAMPIGSDMKGGEGGSTGPDAPI